MHENFKIKNSRESTFRQDFDSRKKLITILEKAGWYDTLSFPIYEEYARQIIERYGDNNFLENNIAASLFIISNLILIVNRTGKLPHKQDLFVKNIKKDIQSYSQLKRIFEKAQDLRTVKDLDNLKIIQKHDPKPLKFNFLEKILGFTSFILPKKIREEFIGDIRETRKEMLKKGFSKLAINAITFFRICSVIWSAFGMRLSDLFESEKENSN